MVTQMQRMDLWTQQGKERAGRIESSIDICIPPRQWHPTPVLLPGKSHGWRSLVGCSPWGHWESETTERLHFSFSLSCTGEGNGNPLQCSCLENPRDGGVWWAAISGVAQSRTRLKWLSSSSSSVWNRQLVGSCCVTQEAHPGSLYIKGQLWLTRAVVRRKPTQHCKAIILQLKNLRKWLSGWV